MNVEFPKKRNSNDNQIEMFDLITEIETNIQGVGARQNNTPTALEGGRYLDICTKYGLPVTEICASDLSLNSTWKTIAEKIGMDQFIWLMKFITEIQHARDCGQSLYFPVLSKIEYGYRKKFIKYKHKSGENLQEIQKELKNIGVNISLRTIRRIINER